MQTRTRLQSVIEDLLARVTADPHPRGIGNILLRSEEADRLARAAGYPAGPITYDYVKRLFTVCDPVGEAAAEFLLDDSGRPRSPNAKAYTLRHLDAWARDLGMPRADNGQSPRRSSLRDVRAGLHARADQGEVFTSMEALATDLGCAKGTVHKVIHADDRLRRWAGLHDKRRRPRAVALADGVAQMTEADPADAALAALIDAAEPAERARLHAMPEGQLRELAALALAQRSDGPTAYRRA